LQAEQAEQAEQVPVYPISFPRSKLVFVAVEAKLAWQEHHLA
jgi:hypothetical protein